MKILWILNSLALGGAENYSVSLINNLAYLGHEIELIVLSNEITLKNKLSPLIIFKVYSRKHKLDFNVIKEIYKSTKNNNFQAIISSSVIYSRLSTLLSNRPIATLYPIHSTIPLRKKYAIINYLLYHSKKRNEIFITSIKSQTNYLRAKYKLGKSYFEEIHNGIDTNIFNIRTAKFDRSTFLYKKGIFRADKLILMVAGFRPEKRHDIAINAFRLLIKEYPDTKLVFIGNDSFNKKDELERGVRDLSNSIFFYSNINEEDLIHFYWSADMFTLTSDNETFPISALEAMATGLPCIMTNTGGMKDFLLPGINGELAEVNDHIDIKRKWERVLLNLGRYCSTVIRQIIVKNYSIDRATQRYIELINRYVA